jgi:hypothetical protein
MSEQDTGAKFTPGPWLIHATNRVIVQADDAFNNVTVKDGRVTSETEDDMPVSICLLRNPDEDFSEDETLANGFLIAAAPELYEALSETCAWLEDNFAGGELRERARLALAKARGERA